MKRLTIGGMLFFVTAILFAQESFTLRGRPGGGPVGPQRHLARLRRHGSTDPGVRAVAWQSVRSGETR